ncbi:hypothetical protein ACIO6U_06500 [Streptomyces sp. NPDC087422]|uniref:hypothetical protein n=1 Tax=Streptomyces sp. NPDC087422 TaxID=3365786 RepID=UPI003806F81A
MRKSRIAAVLGVAGAFLAVNAGQAEAVGLTTANVPYSSGGRIYASATLSGPNIAGTQLCVDLLATYPYGPDIDLGGACKTIGAGTVTYSIPNSCGNYRSFAYVKQGGKNVVTKFSAYGTWCQ